MPRIDDAIQNCVIYLYPAAEEARAGKRAGGSGFIMAVGSAENSEGRLLYAVTNSRVIKSGFPVVRADTLDREIALFEKGRKEWVHHPGGEDVAACLLGLASDYPRIGYYLTNDFLTRDGLGPLGIGVGSDVFLMGRFLNARGVQLSAPAARFGYLAMTDRQPVPQPDGGARESFLVRGLEPGEHTGGPVFVYSEQSPGGEPSPGRRAPVQLFLGIDQGHVRRDTRVVNARGEPHPRGWKVSSPHGPVIVTPAWKLKDLLRAEQLMDTRRELERQRGVKLDSEVGDDFTGIDFLKVLALVSRRADSEYPAADERAKTSLPRTPSGSGQTYRLEDFSRDFPDDDSCLNWLAQYLYPGGIQCPKCREVTPHARIVKRRSFSCARCGHHTHPTVGTIFHNSRKSLRPWFEAIYMVASAGGRITATQLERELGVHYKTALRMRGKIREMLSKKRTQL
jgi:transposase-like protein